MVHFRRHHGQYLQQAAPWPEQINSKRMYPLTNSGRNRHRQCAFQLIQLTHLLSTPHLTYSNCHIELYYGQGQTQTIGKNDDRDISAS